MTYKKKTKPAAWVSAFPKQAKALHPENSSAGGVKARSHSQAVRMAIYNAINELYICSHPYCEACHLIWPNERRALLRHWRDDTHHLLGKDGLLLFDVRHFKSVCRRAHQWIDANPDAARKLGLLADKGDWNKQG